MPTISVIVPVYNVEPYIHRCIDSILAQAYTDFELILVDDGSPDNCGEICDEYAAKDSRIKVIHKENGGVSSARNAGLDIATGEYIAFVDSDDWIRCDFLEVAYQMSMEHNLDLFISGFSRVQDDETLLFESVIDVPISAHNGTFSPNEMTALLENNYISGPCGKLYKRSAINGSLFDETMCFGEDLKYVYGILNRSNSIMAVHSPLYYYRTNPNSLINAVTVKKCQSVSKTYSILFDDSIKRFGKEKNAYSSFLQMRFSNDYNYTMGQICEKKCTSFAKARMLISLFHRNGDIWRFIRLNGIRATLKKIIVTIIR